MGVGKGRCRGRITSWTFSLFDLGFGCWMGVQGRWDLNRILEWRFFAWDFGMILARD
jgi:hypothetical protein